MWHFKTSQIQEKVGLWQGVPTVETATRFSRLPWGGRPVSHLPIMAVSLFPFSGSKMKVGKCGLNLISYLERSTLHSNGRFSITENFYKLIWARGPQTWKERNTCRCFFKYLHAKLHLKMYRHNENGHWTWALTPTPHLDTDALHYEQCTLAFQGF